MDAVAIDVLDEPPADREDHPIWSAMQLARLLQVDDGFERVKIACAFLATAQTIIETGHRLPFAVLMEEVAHRLARQALHMEN